jgi:hypothetical protein
LHSSGHQGSTLNYMRKQMSPQAWWALSKRVRRSSGGPFLGRRWGTTANINTRARGCGSADRLDSKSANIQTEN